MSVRARSDKQVKKAEIVMESKAGIEKCTSRIICKNISWQAVVKYHKQDSSKK